MEGLEPIVGKIRPEKFKDYYGAAISDIHRIMDAPQPTFPVTAPPTAGDFGSPGAKGLTNKNLTALEGQMNLWGDYYLKENRKIVENSEAKILKLIAQATYASNAQIQKLESAIIRGLLASDQSNQKTMTEFEEIKSILYSINGDCSKGFKDLIPVDGSAIAANVEGLQKNIVNELVSSEARTNIARRADNSKLRDELKAHLNSGPPRRNSNMGRGTRAPSTVSLLDVPNYDPTTATASDQVFHTQTDSTGNSNPSQDTTTIAGTNANGNNRTKPKIKPPHKVPNFNEATGELSFTYAARTAAGIPQKKNTRNNTPSQRGPDFELRDTTKNPEKAKRTAENQAVAEEKADREFIVYNLETESSRVDFEAEFKRLGEVIAECSTDNLGSQGQDFMKIDFKDVQLKRIYKYGGEGYTGIYPLKVECTNRATKEAVIKCAKAGGFFERRTQVDIGWFQSGVMTAEEFKTKANKFHINISTTFLQRKNNRNKKKENEERKNTDEYKYNQAWRSFDNKITHTFTEQELDKIWPSLKRGPKVNNQEPNTTGQQSSTTPATPATTPATTTGVAHNETPSESITPNLENESDGTDESAMDQGDPESILVESIIFQHSDAQNSLPVTQHPKTQQELTNREKEPQTQSVTQAQVHQPPGIMSTGSPPAAVAPGLLIDITSPIKKKQQEDKEEYDNLNLELRIMEQRLINHTKTPLMNEEEELACLQRKEELQIKIKMKNQANISLKPALGSLNNRTATVPYGNVSTPPPNKKTRISSSSSAPKRIIPNQQRPTSNSSPISKDDQTTKDNNSPKSPEETNKDKHNGSLNHSSNAESLP